jgi:hypothetical protein
MQLPNVARYDGRKLRAVQDAENSSPAPGGCRDTIPTTRHLITLFCEAAAVVGH